MRYSSKIERPGHTVMVAARSGRILYQAPQPAHLVQEAEDMARIRARQARKQGVRQDMRQMCNEA